MRSLLVTLSAAVVLTLFGPTIECQGAPAQAAPAAGVKQAGDPGAPPLLDVNAASVEELRAVPGIGERLAQSIVDLRTKKGSFTRLEDLLEVRGIGERSLQLLSVHLTVAQAPAGASAPGK